MLSKKQLKYLHDIKNNTIMDGKQIIHGDKRLLIKYYHKENDNKEKIIIVNKKEDEYIMKVTENDKVEEILKELKKNKKLKFVLDYVTIMKINKIK